MSQQMLIRLLVLVASVCLTTGYLCPEHKVTVSNSNSLRSALKSAKPGTVIHINRGFYEGSFVASGRGNSRCFIRLEGDGNGENSILTGRGDEPVLTFKNTQYWIVNNFVVEGGDVSIKVDGAKKMQFDTITVHNSGSHGWWITHSSDNYFRRLQIYNTGRLYSQLGAGIRIGTPWHEGKDNCQNNKFVRLRIGPGIKAPGIEMLQGSSNGLIKDSYFDQIPHFLSFKGNGWKVTGCKMRTLRSKESADGITFDAVNADGRRNTVSGCLVDMTGASAADYCAFLTAPALKTGNKVCKSNTFKGYRVSPSNKKLDDC